MANGLQESLLGGLKMQTAYHNSLLYENCSNIDYISIREPKHQGRLKQIKRHLKINIGS